MNEFKKIQSNNQTTSTNFNDLEKLKNEILQEVQEVKVKKDSKKISWASGLITAALAVLLLISLVQTAQAVSILNKIEGGALKSTTTNTPGNDGVLPSGLQDLPDMVGGC